MACTGVIVSCTAVSPHASPHVLSILLSTICTPGQLVPQGFALCAYSAYVLGVLHRRERVCGVKDKVPGFPLAYQHGANTTFYPNSGQVSFEAINSVSTHSLFANPEQLLYRLIPISLWTDFAEMVQIWPPSRGPWKKELRRSVKERSNKDERWAKRRRTKLPISPETCRITSIYPT